MFAVSSNNADEERLLILTWSHKPQQTSGFLSHHIDDIVADMSEPCMKPKPRRTSTTGLRTTFKEPADEDAVEMLTQDHKRDEHSDGMSWILALLS
jgi:hypothetical protein